MCASLCGCAPVVGYGAPMTISDDDLETTWTATAKASGDTDGEDGGDTDGQDGGDTDGQDGGDTDGQRRLTAGATTTGPGADRHRSSASSTAWVDRRQFHTDAPRLADFVDDPGRFVIGELACRPCSVDAPWGDAERLWDRFLAGASAPPASASFASAPRWRDGTTAGTRRSATSSSTTSSSRIACSSTTRRGATVVLQALQFTDRTMPSCRRTWR